MNCSLITANFRMASSDKAYLTNATLATILFNFDVVFFDLMLILVTCLGDMFNNIRHVS